MNLNLQIFKEPEVFRLKLFCAILLTWMTFSLSPMTYALVADHRALSEEYFNDLVPQEESLASPQKNMLEPWRFIPFARVPDNSLQSVLKRSLQIVVHKSMLDLGYQFMEVFVDDKLYFRFTVSTAWERTAKGKSGRTFDAKTPAGVFVADALEAKRYSNLWKVWLKYVIRFNSGIWIHATTPDHYSELGAPASSGCIRLHEDDAKLLFELASVHGIKELAITILPAASGEKQLMPKKAPGRVIESVPLGT